MHLHLFTGFLHPVAKVLIQTLPSTNFFDFATKKPKYQLCQDELCSQHDKLIHSILGKKAGKNSG